MIVRINLHPERKFKAKATPFKTVGIVLGIILLVEVIVCAVVYSNLDSEVKQLANQERQLTHERDEIKTRLADVDKIKKQIDELRNRELTFAKLAALRTGPQYVMNEMSRILSNPRDVVARKAATEQEWSLSWDPDNIIINKFIDSGNNQIEITGVARSMDDISEFWKRMKTSPLLRNVRLGEIKDSKDSSLNIVTQTFSFTADVNFNYQTQDGLALIDMLTAEDKENAEAPADGAAEAAPAQP